MTPTRPQPTLGRPTLGRLLLTVEEKTDDELSQAVMDLMASLEHDLYMRRPLWPGVRALHAHTEEQRRRWREKEEATP